LNFTKLNTPTTRGTYWLKPECQDLTKELLPMAHTVWVSSWSYMNNITRHPDVNSTQKDLRQYEVLTSVTFSAVLLKRQQYALNVRLVSTTYHAAPQYVVFSSLVLHSSP
jgi:hypothetical protein